MKYTTLLFDADGTLFDFLLAEKEALAETLFSFKIEPTEEIVASYSEINDGLWKALERGEIEKDVLRYKRFELFCEKHGFVCDIKKMSEMYTDKLSTKGLLYDGAHELCRKLYNKARLYIVTNGIDFVQKGRMDLSGISNFFETSFISGEIGYEKPDTRFFEHVAKHIDGFDKSKTIIVGDSLSSDIKGGIAFGIDTCWYNPNGKPIPENMPITYVANNFENVYRILCGTGENDQ